ncbi:a-macroglobulin complement component domain-containing protein [Ditylenchus destructor]|uniref:A-macroglobulin complement component domain-containing protein n=1 Tax=Ditylenchus destructor TaxID=166010 RepID=A0AAD4RDK1_9BILA|nr:a-macroglobulin complement component domain-containing protein [Ditylenchus destructor]
MPMMVFNRMNSVPEAGMSDTVASSASPFVGRVRKRFPETWLWASQQDFTLRSKAPDTITSWVASAFAISENAGLGVAPSVSKLKVFRPFFIRLELPYSVKRGEKFALQVLIFNYLENEQDVVVTLKHQEGAGFDKQDKNYNIRSIAVPGGGASKAVYFPIVLTEIGMVKLSVMAQAGAQAGDAVEMPLRVEPEGYRVNRNVPLILDLSRPQLQATAVALPTSSSSGEAVSAVTKTESMSGSGKQNNTTSAGKFKKVIELEFPSDHVQGSKIAKIDIIGDIMGPVLSNVEGLVKMPFGCGEQNMVTFVPNIVVMRYLKATRRSNPVLEAKAIKHMESGYQRQLTYRRSDNSFSAFGQSDSHGSTWLTAFVIRSFKQAQAYIFVDEQVLEKSIAFLISQQQAENGAFAERGEVHHKQMQGGASEGGLPLTAYVLIALLENGVQNEKAKIYLESHISEIKDDPYSLAVCAYALQLANSPKHTEVIKLLEAQQIASNDGNVHWSAKVRPERAATKDTSQYFYQSQPVDIEVTSYALLNYMQLADTEKGLPIVRWLTSQRNSLGGFSSTQDTVMALQALGAYAERAYSPNFNLTIKVQNGPDSQHFTVNSQNAIVLQSYELSHLDSPIEIDASGSSVAFVQVQYAYHRQTLRDDEPFYCSKELKDVRGGNQRLQFDLCCNYTKSGQRSNMAVAEINALSGYRFDNDELDKLTGISDLQRVELENDDTKANIYFNPIGDSPVCLSLYSDLVYQIAEQKPAHFVLFDYYDPEQQIKSTYSSKQTRSLDENCAECWPTSVDSATGGSRGRSAESLAPENITLHTEST